MRWTASSACAPQIGTGARRSGSPRAAGAGRRVRSRRLAHGVAGVRALLHGGAARREIRHFFEVSKELEPKKTGVGGWEDRDAALRAVREAQERYRNAGR